MLIEGNLANEICEKNKRRKKLLYKSIFGHHTSRPPSRECM